MTAHAGAQSATLPDAIDGAVYLRPLAFVAGAAARVLVARGEAAWLAGGPLAFSACEVSVRGGATATRHTASLAALRRWHEGLEPAARDRVGALLEGLGAARRGPDGGNLDRPLVMGIVNVTPDSFSDGGAHADPAAAIAHGLALAEAGADIIDVGGESTRPGATPISEEDELARVVPVLDGLGARFRGPDAPLISIDTRNAAVMAAALERGARLINDVSALRANPRSLALAAGSGATVVLMHMRGEPATMNEAPAYDDVALDVFDFLEARVEACARAGIPRRRLIVDPGIGFAKRGRHNLAVLRHVALYHGLGCPVLLGLSRKGLSGEFERRNPPGERLPGSLAATVHALDRGVQMFRVHDVAETRLALDVWSRLIEES